jgi:hypothetical protein
MKNVDDDDDDDRYGFYSRRGIFLLGVSQELMLYLEVNIAKGVLAKVCAPQSGERLTRRVDGVCHCVRSDGVFLGGNASIAVPMGKYLEDWDGIDALPKEGGNVVLDTKLFPEDPMRLRCFGTLGEDFEVGDICSKFICAIGDVTIFIVI